MSWRALFAWLCVWFAALCLGVVAVASVYDNAPRKPPDPARVFAMTPAPRGPDGCVTFSTAEVRAWADSIDAEERALWIADCVVVQPAPTVPPALLVP